MVYSLFNMSNLLINFWYGKISLWKSFWIVGELLNTLVILAIYYVEFKYFNNINLFVHLPSFDFYNLSWINKIIFIIWSIFITVGIWRSAESYKGSKIWIILTLIVLCFRIFSLRLILY